MASCTPCSRKFRSDYLLTIIAMNLENHPQAAGDNWGEKATQEQLPDLSFVPDISWGLWFRNYPNAKNVRLYGAHRIVNDDTRSLVARTLTITGINTLHRWPGDGFEITTPAGLALLRSPIDRTIATCSSATRPS
jgi:hypothetical protein